MANVAGSALSGAMGGASTGSALGPYGAAAGAVIGAIGGGFKAAKAEEASQIPGADAGEVARLEELRRMRQQLQTGTDPLTRLDITEAKRVGRGAQHAVSRVTGGDVGGTISALRGVQGATQGRVNRSIAEASKRVPYFDNAVGGLTSRIADRKLQLQLLNRAQRQGESAQATTDANVSGQALLGAIGGGLGQDAQGNFTGQGFFGGLGNKTPDLGVPNTSPVQGVGTGLETGFTQGIPNQTLSLGQNNFSNPGAFGQSNLNLFY